MLNPILFSVNSTANLFISMIFSEKLVLITQGKHAISERGQNISIFPSKEVSQVPAMLSIIVVTTAESSSLLVAIP